MGYPDPRGTNAARAALSAYINRSRGTAAHPDRMVICNGFTQGFRLTCTVLRRLGIEAIATEDPSHEEQREAVRDAGLKCITIPVDGQGIIVERLEKTEARAVLVTPAHQYPTGAVLAPQRRAALLDWAVRKQAYIIEDDYDAEFRYDREPIGALHGVAPDRVIYIGSASKTLAPALRLGWLVAPTDLVEAFAATKKRDDLGSASLEQLAFADFIERGELDRHLRRMRRLYRRRRELLLKALRNHMPERRVFGVAAGLHLMLELPADADEGDIVTRARQLSVNISGTRTYRARAKLPPSLILGYGSLRDSAVAEGVKRLAAVVERR
jgi:GntR family transcriptional regulator/MocR family aminotransferase